MTQAELVERWLPHCRGDRHWGVARVHIPGECTTRDRIMEMGTTAWLPTYTEMTRRRGRRRPEEVERPAMRGYLFVDVRTIGNLEAVYEALGFMYFVRFNGMWALIDDATLDDLRRLEGPDARDLLKPPLRLRDVVQVRHDASFALGGMVGCVLSLERGEGRVTVGGRDFPMPVSMPATMLEPAR